MRFHMLYYLLVALLVALILARPHLAFFISHSPAFMFFVLIKFRIVQNILYISRLICVINLLINDAMICFSSSHKGDNNQHNDHENLTRSIKRAMIRRKILRRYFSLNAHSRIRSDISDI